MVGVSYTDGRTAYFRVDREDAIYNALLSRLAHEQRASGAIPAGTIASVKRVR
jgi:hypothetical protein